MPESIGEMTLGLAFMASIASVSSFTVDKLTISSQVHINVAMVKKTFAFTLQHATRLNNKTSMLPLLHPTEMHTHATGLELMQCPACGPDRSLPSFLISARSPPAAQVGPHLAPFHSCGRGLCSGCASPQISSGYMLRVRQGDRV